MTRCSAPIVVSNTLSSSTMHELLIGPMKRMKPDVPSRCCCWAIACVGLTFSDNRNFVRLTPKLNLFNDPLTSTNRNFQIQRRYVRPTDIEPLVATSRSHCHVCIDDGPQGAIPSSDVGRTSPTHANAAQRRTDEQQEQSAKSGANQSRGKTSFC